MMLCVVLTWWPENVYKYKISRPPYCCAYVITTPIRFLYGVFRCRTTLIYSEKKFRTQYEYTENGNTNESLHTAKCPHCYYSIHYLSIYFQFVSNKLIDSVLYYGLTLQQLGVRGNLCNFGRT